MLPSPVVLQLSDYFAWCRFFINECAFEAAIIWAHKAWDDDKVNDQNDYVQATNKQDGWYWVHHWESKLICTLFHESHRSRKMNPIACTNHQSDIKHKRSEYCPFWNKLQLALQSVLIIAVTNKLLFGRFLLFDDEFVCVALIVFLFTIDQWLSISRCVYFNVFVWLYWGFECSSFGLINISLHSLAQIELHDCKK